MFNASPPCANDPAMFFSKNPARREQAKGVCSTCPFQDPCRDLSNLPIQFDDSTYIVQNGIWAGEDRSVVVSDLTPKQRQMTERAAQVKKYLDEGLSKYAIGKKMGIGQGSVTHTIKYYLTNEEAR